MSYLSDEPTDKDMFWAEGYAYARAQVDDLEERNAKLVAALKAVLDPPSTFDEPDMDIELILKMRKIAREALQQSTEKP